MKSLNYFFTLAIASLIIVSCKGDDLLEANSSIPEQLQVILEEHPCLSDEINGYLFMHTFKTLPTQDIDESSMAIRAVFYDENGKVDKGTLNIGGEMFEADQHNEYHHSSILDLSEYDGNTKSISLKDGSTTFFDHQFQFPNRVRILSPVFSNSIQISDSNNFISWEVDNSTSYEAAISISYSPNHLPNQSFKDAGYDEHIRRTIPVPDNGSYSFQSSDFEGIPEGAFISFNVLRVNCSTVSDIESNGNYIIISYSEVTAGATFEGFN